MKLIDLDPRWVNAGGPGVTKDGKPVPIRIGVGISFDCPCGCEIRVYVDFSNPIDGLGPASRQAESHSWNRTGNTFETLTLTPSILRSRDKGGCGWHGFVTAGEVTGRIE